MGKEEGTFWDYLSEARSEFVIDINKQLWSTELRMAAENILIAYDQVVERYRKLEEVLGFKDEIFNKSL
ncbi:MAG: hypothetical protein WC055_15910 [Melioribacteraceae bacterium]